MIFMWLAVLTKLTKKKRTPTVVVVRDSVDNQDDKLHHKTGTSDAPAMRERQATLKTQEERLSRLT
jgi:hypothetical protein